MDAASTFSELEAAITSVQADERDEALMKLREIVLLASRYGWKRPFVALFTMRTKKRDLVRQTLQFEWDKNTRECQDFRRRAQLEAWEIIDCNIRGIASRLHTIGEQLNPVRYLSWRQALIRVLELANHLYKATDSEENLESLVLDVFQDNKRTQNRDQTDIPTFGLPKGGKAGIILSITRDIAGMWDGLLGSEDGPAVAAVFALCEVLKN
jgi:hypothetical protein